MPYMRYKSTKQTIPPPAALAAGGFGLLVLVAAWLFLTETPDRIRRPVPEMAHAAAPAPAAVAPAAATAKPLKLVYRNSVIPGGVHSAAELAAALQHDPVAAAHYANFDVAAAHVVRVGQSRLVHVSYRIGDKIYWTKNKVRLAQGESLLYDGKHQVRARCGNRIADEPQGPVLDDEPAPEVLDAVFVSAEELVDQTLNMAAAYNGPSPALAAVAATVAQAPEMRSALITPLPTNLFPNLSGLRHARLPPLPVDTPAFAPPIVEVVDANVLGSVVNVTVPAPEPAAHHLPGATQAQSPDTLASKEATMLAPDSPAPFPPTPTQALNPAAATSTATPVPEPGSAALAALALVVLTLVRRRSRRGHAAPTQPS